MTPEAPQTSNPQIPASDQAKDQNSAKLTGAKEALKQKLLRAVMQQAMVEIGEPESIAEKVLSAFRSDMPQIPAASGRLRELVVSEIARSALDSIEDAESTAREIGESISMDHHSVRQVIDALGRNLTRFMEEAALDSVADATSTADRIAADISLDRDEIQSVVEALRDRLTNSVRDQALSAFENVEEAAREIRAGVPENHELLAAVRTRLYEMLLDESREGGMSRLEDTDAVAMEIRETLGEDPEPVVRLGDEIRSKLLEEARQRSVGTLENTDEVAQQIISTLGEDPDVVSRAVEEVRNRLLDAIRDSSVRSISDSVSTANEARKRLDSDPEEVVHASEHLKDLMLREIVHVSMKEISDVETAARSAFDRVDRHAMELQQVKDALKTRILNHVLNSAIHEISAEVGTAASELSSTLVGQVTSTLQTEDLDAAAAELFEDVSVDVTEMTEPVIEESSWMDDDTDTNDDADTNDDTDTPIAGDPNEVVESPHDDDGDAAELEAILNSNNAEPESDHADESERSSEVVDEADSGVSDREEDAVHSWRSLDSFDAEVSEFDFSMGDDEALEAVALETFDIEATTPSDEQAVADTVYYVYGIMTSAGDAFDGPLPLGIQSGRVETVDFDGLSAVVSVVPGSIFYGDALKANLSNAAWLQENVRKHASIVEQLRSRQTLLPMPFCTILPSREKVVRMLEASYSQYFDSLDRVDGKQEWGLRIYRNRELLEGRVSESDRRVEGALGAISRGVSGYLRDEMQRMEQGSGQDPIELVTEHCTQRSHEAMLSNASEGRQNPDRGGQERAGEDLVLNTAYLVDNDTDSEVRAEVERLRAEYAELGFRFELTGPWPPYHFVGSEGSRAAARSAQS